MPREVFRKVPKGTPLKVMRSAREYNKVDRKILHLMVKLNKLGFVKTHNSCEGHATPGKTREKMSLSDGDLRLSIDLNHPQGKKLVRDLKKLSNKKHWVSFKPSQSLKEIALEQHGELKDWKLGSFDFKMSASDVTGRFQEGNVEKVLQRKKDFDRVWDEMEKIVEKHLKN
jgi:hypothetical protein